MAKKGKALHDDGPHIWAERRYLELMLAHCEENDISVNQWAKVSGVELATLKLLIMGKQRLTLYNLWRLSTAIGLAPFTKFRAAKEHELYENKTRMGAERRQVKAKPVAKIKRLNGAEPVPDGISRQTGKPKCAPRGKQVAQARAEAEHMEAVIYAGTEIVPEMKVMPSAPKISGTRPDNYSSLPERAIKEPTVEDLEAVQTPAKPDFHPQSTWKPMPVEEAQAQTNKERESRGQDITGSIMDQFLQDRQNNRGRKFAT